MRKKTSRKRDKPHFAHDENLEFIQLKKHCSRQALFTSAIRLMKTRGAEDPDIIEMCEKKDLHVITHNTKDFTKIREGFKLGAVWIGLKDVNIWVSKFARMLRILPKHRHYYYKNIHIQNLILSKNRITGEVRII